jgi:hypothetical protein
MPRQRTAPTTPVLEEDPAVFPAPAQREALLLAKAWWAEGERALDHLAERARQESVLTQLRPHLDRLRAAVNEPTAEVAAPVLRLARRLSANRALNRDRETDAFARALRRLLFGDDPLPVRLAAFLTESGVGEQTASQMLCAAFPERFPLVSDATRAALAATPLQRAAARSAVLEGYELEPDRLPRPVLDLLADFALYEAARRTLGVASFLDVNAVLWHAREAPRPVPIVRPRRRTEAPLPPAPVAVRESRNEYRVAPAYSPAPAAEAEPAATETALLDYVEGYVAAQGFTFPSLALRDYYVALKTRPFVILAGLSGTGKTRLTELFAEALAGEAGAAAQYRLLPVRPDWTDPSPLLGYHNVLTGEYISTPLLSLLREAARPENRERAYFVTLDEMNLARAEHYLADLLSAMETRRREVVLQGTGEAVTLGPNVFLAGTVNVDEAAHPFSRKVLDRANTIEFSAVDLAPRAGVKPSVLPAIAPQERQWLFLSARVSGVAEAERRLGGIDPAFLGRVLGVLTALNKLLEPRGLHVGYRVRDEFFCYAANAFDRETGASLLLPGASGEENLAAALDLLVVQKALPRVAGTQEALEKALAALERWASEEGFGRARAKVARMRARAEEDGVVSFYEP